MNTKEDLRVESLVSIALVLSILGVMCIVRELNYRVIPGVGPIVIKSVPLHFAIVGISKLITWYSHYKQQ